MRTSAFGLLAATAALAIVASTAQAADLPSRYSPAPAYNAMPMFTWSGFYAGLNAGYGWSTGTSRYYDPAFGVSGGGRKGGFIGGAQAGYNYQTGCTLFGVEADWAWSDTNASGFNSDGDGPVGAVGVDTSTVSSRMRWFGTVRARSGVVVDNVLIYATGGFAYANFARSYTIFEDAPATISTFTWNNTRWGWTAGVGTEWAFAPNWSLKSEVLYMRFEKDTATATGLGAPGAGLLGAAYRLESQNDAWISRIGVNYRF